MLICKKQDFINERVRIYVSFQTIWCKKSLALRYITSCTPNFDSCLFFGYTNLKKRCLIQPLVRKIFNFFSQGLQDPQLHNLVANQLQISLYNFFYIIYFNNIITIYNYFNTIFINIIIVVKHNHESCVRRPSRNIAINFPEKRSHSPPELSVILLLKTRQIVIIRIFGRRSALINLIYFPVESNYRARISYCALPMSRLRVVVVPGLREGDPPKLQ